MSGSHKDRGNLVMGRRAYNLVFHENGYYEGSTVLRLGIGTSFQTFCLSVTCLDRKEPIDYLKFVRIHQEKSHRFGAPIGIFELTEVLPACNPQPYPIISSSDVLWHRLEAVLVHQNICAFQQELDVYRSKLPGWRRNFGYEEK
ncbi:MAG: hypothetical protein LBK01_00070 [Burkholderiaceae bacterium]|jgi:hypothetical protein|nr:hypothetical protein [Burkholderiaceae bacterium]